MYIVIVGAGKVGSYVARIFVEEGHDVALIELDGDLARSLDATLNALVLHGSGVRPDTLREAGIERADLFLAVTAVDEVNLIACMTARKHGRDGMRTVARVRQAHYLAGDRALSAKDLGLDALISPEESISTVTDDILRYSGGGEMRELAGGRLALIGMDLSADSPLVYESLADIAADLPKDLLVVAVQGRSGVRIPGGADRLQIGERAFVLTVPRNFTELAILSGQPWHPVKRALVIGCGNTGLAVTRELKRQGFELTVIEKDPARAEFVAQRLEGSLVLQGDGTDPDFLKKRIEEGRIDAALVLLKDPEKAVLIGIFAKSLGAGKVVVRCDKPAIARLANTLGVDAVISQKRAMTDAIVRYVRLGTVKSTLLLGENEAEIIGLKISQHPARSEIIEKPLKELAMPPDALIGAVVRGDEVFIASNGTVLRPGDEVFVACRQESLGEVERLFS